ncbi:hypothetical protein M2352_002538 [Azospirillum fermentarium]|uniref:hypothetical protein n=1 Tax=Azospirillum fermentarium TaxID=1233114 RepID=UPI002225DC10|nr:hypothetical protein [Azospirillum fermentarium]MCW2246947.1 hypothetical protein [Azospirillum fermentarium]
MVKSLPGPLVVHPHNVYSGSTLHTEGKFDTPGPGRNALFTTVILPDGQQHRVQIDTGSCGLVLPASMLTDSAGKPLPHVKYVRSFSMTYHPSGDVVAGAIYAIEYVQFPLADGSGVVTTDPLYILGTDRGDPGMMGIGFGRANVPAGTDQPYPNCVPPAGLFSSSQPAADTDGEAAKNPAQLSNALLNIQGMAAGTVPANYVITSGPISALALGVDSTDLGKFDFLTLSKQYPKLTSYPPNSPYYATPSYQITLSAYNDGKPFPCPTLLDTGVDCIMIRIPPGGDSKHSISGWTSGYDWASPNLLGQTLTVSAYPTGSTTPMMQYSFAFGTVHATYTGSSPSNATVTANLDPAQGSTAMAPSNLLPLAEASTAPTTFFINIGINPLANYDYCFDANNSRVGFRPALAPFDNGGIQ